MVKHKRRHWFLIFAVLLSYTSTTVSHVFTNEEQAWIEHAMAAEPWITVHNGIVVTHRFDQQQNAASRIVDRILGKKATKELCTLTQKQLLTLQRRGDVDVLSMNVRGEDVVLVKFPHMINSDMLQKALGLTSRSQMHCTMPQEEEQEQNILFLAPAALS